MFVGSWVKVWRGEFWRKKTGSENLPRRFRLVWSDAWRRGCRFRTCPLQPKPSHNSIKEIDKSRQHQQNETNQMGLTAVITAKLNSVPTQLPPHMKVLIESNSRWIRNIKLRRKIKNCCLCQQKQSFNRFSHRFFVNQLILRFGDSIPTICFGSNHFLKQILLESHY